MRPSFDFATLSQFWRQDVLAGFLVFLIALPLCLGIAVASGFPPMAGIISAVIGGLLVSRFNSSRLTITGPAAGMIVVILISVQNLGQGDMLAGYRYTLAAIVLAGLLQVGLGFFRAGRLAAFFPASVIHGLLAAIGILIMLKQLPVMFGVQISTNGSMLSALGQLPTAFTFLVPKIALIALLGLCILIGWPQLQHPQLRKIPAPLLVIVTGIALGQLMGLAQFKADELYKLPETLHLDGPFLLVMQESLLDSFYGPDFAQIASLAFWESVLSITLIGSLETLISTVAVDKLDPLKHRSDLNQDLCAVGIGNTLAGLLGGLPMITEIIRSSANIEQGAKSSWANFFHGAFLLLFVLLFPHILTLIPLASLAALLVYTGWRLASPKVFADTWELGKEQMLLFVATILAVLETNLLAGVLIGMVLKLLLLLMRGIRPAQLLKLDYHLSQTANGWQIDIHSPALFCNFLGLKQQLTALPAGKTVIVSLTGKLFVDYTVTQFLLHFKDDYNAAGGGCELRGLAKNS